MTRGTLAKPVADGYVASLDSNILSKKKELPTIGGSINYVETHMIRNY